MSLLITFAPAVKLRLPEAAFVTNIVGKIARKLKRPPLSFGFPRLRSSRTSWARSPESSKGRNPHRARTPSLHGEFAGSQKEGRRLHAQVTRRPRWISVTRAWSLQVHTKRRSRLRHASYTAYTGRERPSSHVRITGPSPVTATVFSKCAEGFSSRVHTSHPSLI